MSARRLVVAVLFACCVVFAVLVGAVGVAGASESFGISSFGVGSSSSQAGAHGDFTTSFAFNTEGLGGVVGQARNVVVDLPVGVVGDPQAVPRCTPGELAAFDCQPSAQVGVLTTRFAIAGEEPFEETTAVYNMVPSPGHAATLATSLAFATVLVQADVRRDGSFGVVARVSDISSLLPLQSSSLTLWGVPADPSHDAQRFGPPPGYGSPTAAGVSAAPFMVNPSDCGDGPLEGSLSVESWQGQTATRTASMPAPTGCGLLQSSPGLSVSAGTSQAGSPAGYVVDLGFPQELAPYGLMAPDMRDARVTFPVGTVVNPSAANGLGACSQEQFGLDDGDPVGCPDSSKVGMVQASTPLLEGPLTGSLYLAQQTANPFGSLVAVYLLVEGGGVLAKLAGEVSLDPVTGRVSAVFKNNPQVPLSDVRVSLFDGPGAAFSNPTTCGEALGSAQLAFYSGLLAEPSSAFQVTGCTPGQFSPAFSAGTTSSQAGGLSPLSVTFSRTDQDQDLAGVSVTTPAGLLGILKGVERCGEPQASQGTCAAGSLIGHATVAAGAGPSPVYVTGQVFLTGAYKGAPFGLSIAVPAVAGPFDLGTVVTRAAINVDPHTTQITVTSDPLPTILQGIPLQIKTVNVTIDRPAFIFNPTSCEPLAVNGTLTSTQGATSQVSSPFHAANCAALGFHPAFSVSTAAKTSKQNGASLTVNIGYPTGAQANIHSVVVSLPRQLPSRLTTIQQACTEAAFAQNPASCPPGSNVGTAIATTPVLAGALTGPVYLVSHGGAAFPDLVLILQGEGVTIELIGSIDIKHGVTSSTFTSVPDAPVSSFALKFPQGPHSALTTNLPARAKGNLCGQSLVMPTTITGQNGAQIKQNTKIAVSGCPKAKPTRRAHSKKKTKKGKNKTSKKGNLHGGK